MGKILDRIRHSGASAAAMGEAGRRRVLVSLLCQVFLIMLGMGLVGPIMPLYASSFGVSAAAVGSLVTAFGIARFVTNIPAGALAERIGRKPLLILGPMLSCIAALGINQSTAFEQLIVLRFIQGLGSSMQTTTAMIVMSDITTRENRGRTMSYYQGALLLGQSFGPTLGGLVGEHYGLKAPFIVYGVLAACAALWSFLIVPETRALGEALRQKDLASAPVRQAKPGARPQGATRALLSDLNFVLISLVSLTIFFTRTGSRSTVLPLFGANALGLSTGQIGFNVTVIAVANLLTLNLCGSLCDRFGRKAVIVPGFLVTALALVSFSMSRSYGWFLFSAVLMGIGTGFSGPAPAAYVADLAPAGGAGMTLGLYRTISDVGMSVGPVLLGWVSDKWSYQTALRANAALWLLVGGAFALFAKETLDRSALTPRPKRGWRFTGGG